jgi:hypothetical protein
MVIASCDLKGRTGSSTTAVNLVLRVATVSQRALLTRMRRGAVCQQVGGWNPHRGLLALPSFHRHGPQGAVPPALPAMDLPPMFTAGC